jgi:hypothetical protein
MPPGFIRPPTQQQGQPCPHSHLVHRLGQALCLQLLSVALLTPWLDDLDVRVVVVPHQQHHAASAHVGHCVQQVELRTGVALRGASSGGLGWLGLVVLLLWLSAWSTCRWLQAAAGMRQLHVAWPAAPPRNPSVSGVRDTRGY